MADPSTIDDLPTPALLVERPVFDANVAAMAAVHPGAALRPHVKAFKSSALAAQLTKAGHHNFCAATIREVEGMAKAGLGNDLLLANEVLDARRLGALVAEGHRITVPVDSAETVQAATDGGVLEVLIDVDVGLPGAPARRSRRCRWRHCVGWRDRHLRCQHVGQRDPGRVILSAGHRLRQT